MTTIMAMLLFAGLLFQALGAWIAGSGRAMAIMATICFGLGLIVALVALLPGI